MSRTHGAGVTGAIECRYYGRDSGKTGVVYLTVHNRGTATDRLIAVSTPIAKRAALHTHKMDNKGVMRMRPVEAIELAQGKTIALAPGGTHIMLMGLKYPLREGGTFPLTLTFAEAGSATIAIDVQSATAAGRIPWQPSLMSCESGSMPSRAAQANSCSNGCRKSIRASIPTICV